MKKVIIRFIFIALLISVTLTLLPTGVIASDFGWDTGEQANINFKTNPVPSWLQVFSQGVKIDEAATICHPFDRGRFHWVGNIYQLKDGKWIKLPTVEKWIPTTEGQYSACADAKEAGIYILLAYYDGPTLTPTPTPDLSGDWNTGIEVTIDTAKNPIPSWLQLFAKGVEVNGKTRICHPFKFGLYGWVGEIRQLKDGTWVKLDTSIEWLATKEGTYTACAYAPGAGTYALFGYLK